MFSSPPDEKNITQLRKWLPKLSVEVIRALAPYVDFSGSSKHDGKPIVFRKITFFDSNAREPLLAFIKDPNYDLNGCRFDSELMNTILGESTVYKQLDLVNAILIRKDIGNIIDIGDKYYGHTPLILAVQLGWDELAIKLIERAAKVNVYDKEGNSALHYACLFRNEKLINILLAAGANPHAQNKEKISAADFYLFEWKPIHILAETIVLPIRILKELRGDEFPGIMQKRLQVPINADIIRKMSLRSLSPSKAMLNFGETLQTDYFKNRAWGIFLQARRSDDYHLLPKGFKEQYETKIAGAEGKDEDTQSRNAGKITLKIFENEYKQFLTAEFYNSVLSSTTTHANAQQHEVKRP